MLIIHVLIMQKISTLKETQGVESTKSIFIYSQTGSGKTYTMEGMDDEDDKRGIISRTSSKIFEETSSLVEKVWDHFKLNDLYSKLLRHLIRNQIIR